MRLFFLLFVGFVFAESVNICLFKEFVRNSDEDSALYAKYVLGLGTSKKPNCLSFQKSDSLTTIGTPRISFKNESDYINDENENYYHDNACKSVSEVYYNVFTSLVIIKCDAYYYFVGYKDSNQNKLILSPFEYDNARVSSGVFQREFVTRTYDINGLYTMGFYIADSLIAVMQSRLGRTGIYKKVLSKLYTGTSSYFEGNSVGDFLQFAELDDIGTNTNCYDFNSELALCIPSADKILSFAAFNVISKSSKNSVGACNYNEQLGLPFIQCKPINNDDSYLFVVTQGNNTEVIENAEYVLSTLRFKNELDKIEDTPYGDNFGLFEEKKTLDVLIEIPEKTNRLAKEYERIVIFNETLIDSKYLAIGIRSIDTFDPSWPTLFDNSDLLVISSDDYSIIDSWPNSKVKENKVKYPISYNSKNYGNAIFKNNGAFHLTPVFLMVVLLSMILITF